MDNREPFTITIPYVSSAETWEEYALRCMDIANYSTQRSAHLSKPSTIDFSDTTKFRKVSETAYEAITPGYQMTPKGNQEIIFSNEELKELLIVLNVAMEDANVLSHRSRDMQEIDAYTQHKKMIRKWIHRFSQLIQEK